MEKMPENYCTVEPVTDPVLLAKGLNFELCQYGVYEDGTKLAGKTFRHHLGYFTTKELALANLPLDLP